MMGLVAPEQHLSDKLKPNITNLDENGVNNYVQAQIIVQSGT